jgi:hypothetical protein
MSFCAASRIVPPETGLNAYASNRKGSAPR